MHKNKLALITGSCGLIGSEAVSFFISKGFSVVGVDNDMRGYFLGKEGSTKWLRKKLLEKYPKTYIHISADIRDAAKIEAIFKKYRFDLIIHTAAQPSHDWAIREPLTDFSINANGTMILLENFRKYCPEAVFIFTSSNKVYGDRPNSLPIIEKESRYELMPGHRYYNGIDENMSIDNSLHSLFGVSKTAADIMVQEYGKYFNLYTGIFRCGCMTGSSHSATVSHGFLSYLIKCIRDGKKYLIFGYKGKQVRDNIHAYDVVNAFYHFYLKPRPGEVYNMGGSRKSNISILEAIKTIEQISGKTAIYEITEKPRRGDHIWYISNINKFKSHYPKWDISYTINSIVQEILQNAKI